MALNGFYELKNMYPKLNLFLQSNTRSFLMFESWAKEDDLMYEAAEWLANNLNIPLEID